MYRTAGGRTDGGPSSAFRVQLSAKPAPGTAGQFRRLGSRNMAVRSDLTLQYSDQTPMRVLEGATGGPLADSPPVASLRSPPGPLHPSPASQRQREETRVWTLG